MRSDPLRLRSDLILLLTAAIWGLAFVGQRAGVAHMGPFAFNALRFLVGALVLTPLMLVGKGRRGAETGPTARPRPTTALGRLGGVAVGIVLFAAAGLQQAGIVFTTAGKAGFITSLYVVIVPLLGLALGRRAPGATWVGALLAAAGLYFLTMQGAFRMAAGDLLVLIGAFLWAAHMLLLGHLSPGRDPIRLAFTQFITCAALSGLVALLLETTTAAGIRAAALPILYTGIFSVGVGYTLQVVGQRHAPPADAAILLSMEAVFAVLGGRLLLGEHLTARALAGCVLMLAGILISQLWPTRKPAAAHSPLPTDH